MNNTIAVTTDNYRVVATTTTGFDNRQVSTTIKWEGTDSDVLSREFPPSNVFGADELFQKELEGGFIIIRFSFERQLEDGTWKEINDPRRRLTPPTEIEQAIDAENRDLYPGDFIAECQDCGRNDCWCEDNQANCTNCNDHGCAECDPNWCKNCDSQGCEICDSEGVCKGCKGYSRFEALNKDSGLCESCEWNASLCTQCKYNQSSGDEHICTDCRSDNEWDAAPKCSDCDNAIVPNEGDYCKSCQDFLNLGCIACGNNLSDCREDKLCGGCRQYYSDQERQYVWWRRTLRACMFWR